MKQIAFTWLLCILSICAYAQQITVTGTVTDAENNPLIDWCGCCCSRNYGWRDYRF